MSAAIAIHNAKQLRAMIFRMINMVNVLDPTETVQHTNRVAAYTIEIYEAWARKKGFSEKEIQHSRDILRMAAILHDIGKIGVPGDILKKHNNLSPEEERLYQFHTIYGARLFADINSEFEEMVSIIALTHHEHWDGKGYPGYISIQDGTPIPGYQKADGQAFGKSGTEIPIYGRLVAIANVYDTLLQQLNPKDKFDDTKIVDTILAESGKQFDPEIVVAFLSCIDIIRSIYFRYPD